MRLGLFVAAAAIFSTASIAHADTYNYKFTGVEGETCGVFGGSYCDVQTIDFTLSSTVSPVYHNSSSFVLTDVNIIQDTPGFISTSLATVYENAGGGGAIVFGQPENLSSGFLVGSSQTLTAGSTAHPIYLTGTFPSGAGILNASYDLDTDTSLVVTDISQTPEPSSFLLLSTGLLGVAGVIRKRFA